MTGMRIKGYARYYYFTLIGQRHVVGWRVRKCTGDFPLNEVMNENPGMIVTFWKEVSEVEAKKCVVDLGISESV